MKRYSWEQHYEEAVLETEDARIEERIDAARAAIAARITELKRDHHGTREERVAMSKVLAGLEVLASERIGKHSDQYVSNPWTASSRD